MKCNLSIPLTLFLALPSYANNTSLDNLLELDLNNLLNVEIDTVYGASKALQRTIDAPANITIVTAEDIKQRQYKTLGDLLGAQSGFYTTYDRNYAYLGVRGFSSPGDYSTKILSLLDGQRINDTIYSGGSFGNDFPLDMDMIDRVEIIRGPGSALYGTSAFLCVINVVSKSSKDFSNGEVDFTVGNYGTDMERAVLSHRFDSGAEILFSASRYHSDGDKNLYFKAFDDPSTNNGMANNLDDEDTYKLFLKATYNDFVVEAVHSEFDKVVPTAPWETIFNQPLNSDDSHSFISAKHKTDISSDLTLSSQIAYNRYYFYGDYLYDDGFGGTDLSFDEVTASWIDATVDLSYKQSDDLQWLIGVYGMYSLEEEQIYVYPAWVDFKHDTPNNNYAAYLQTQYKPTKNLNINLGLRYDYYESFGSHVSPRLSFVYSLSELSAIKVIYAQAFRAPNAYELYYDDGFTIGPNPDLQEEVIDNYEIVYEHYFSNKSSLILNAFYYKIDSLITQVDIGGMDVYVNLDEAETLGFEFNYKYELDNGIKTSINYTRQQAEEKSTDEWLANSPKNLANAAVSIPFFSKYNSTFSMQYVGERKNANDVMIDDHLLANLAVSGTDIVDGLDLSLGVYNLFDTNYAHPSSTEHLNPGAEVNSIEQDGINFRMKLKYRF